MLSAIEIGIFIAGLALGSLINYCIYALAYFPRAISPWQRRDRGDGPLSPFTRIPIAGWWLRSGEKNAHGPFFWVRPLLIEASVPILWVWLYRSMMSGITIPTEIRGPVGSMELHVQFVAYSILLALMIVATFIDIDEKTIPDWITLPGTWIGLLGAALLPGWTLWEVTSSRLPAIGRSLSPMHVNSPHAWEISWGQVGPWSSGLWLGLLVWWIWCCSLGNLRWISRRGFRKAFTYAWVGFVRSPNLGLILGMIAVGSGLIVVGYAWLPAPRWQQLFSSLMGIGLGGCMVWSFRIVSGLVLGQEALGFGDVTLMAMVGAFFGWQIVLLAFFLAPLFGLVLVVLYWVITRDGAIPFGPYLAAATTYLMLDWPRVWDAVSPAFLPVNAYVMVLVVLLFVLGSLLWIVRSLKLLLVGLAMK